MQKKFCHENAIENVYQIASILPRPQRVDTGQGQNT